MTRRNGMALPAAIAATIILAGVAALANLSATAAIRESRALRDVAVDRATREAVRARAVVMLRHSARSDLIAAAHSIGGGDTILNVAPLTWPWHALRATTGGSTVFAEFARASYPAVPWCSAVVHAGTAAIADGAMSMALPNQCPDRIEVGKAAIAVFDSAMTTDLLLPILPDTVEIADEISGLVRAKHRIDVREGGRVSGIVIAPVVRIASGAAVRGMLVVRDSLWIASGGLVAADGAAVLAALRGRARLLPLGRRGLLVIRSHQRPPGHAGGIHSYLATSGSFVR